MPNRIVRDGFVDSESVAALTDWSHRVYSNLLVKGDDAGRIDGRLEFLRSHLFPLGLSRRLDELDRALCEIETPTHDDAPLHPLIIRYVFGGKPFIQIVKWARCGSTGRSRFPWRDGSFAIEYEERDTRDGPKEFVKTSLIDQVSTPYVPPADGVRSDPDTETETETETSTETNTKTETGGEPPWFSEVRFSTVWAEWENHRRHKKATLTPETHRSQRKKLALMGFGRAVAAIEYSIEKGWTGIFEEKKNGQISEPPPELTKTRRYSS